MKNKGITLIALVVTIIILLILAAISITVIFGENGIIEQAQRAADETNEQTGQEQQDMGGIQGIIDDVTKSKQQPQIKNSMGKVLSSSSNTTVYDEYNNPVEVPAGFAIVPNGKSNVEYKYTNTPDHIPSVQDGIVITDEIGEDGTSSGNEFVWIPVGTIKNKSGDKNGPTTTITLGRYTFADDGTPSEPKTDGTEINHQFTEYKSDEHTYSNTPAKDIEAFKASVSGSEGKGGYYLARYEASYGGPDSPLSKPSTGKPSTDDGEIYAPGTAGQIGQLWNNISQPDAAKASQNMYNSPNFETDLTNSYAWDTAIVFIQTYSGYSGDRAYSQEYGPTFSKTLRNTGSDENPDKVCNIYDMASNCHEWTTESGGEGRHAYVPRGGDYLGGTESACDRSGWQNQILRFGSFRPVLYMSGAGNGNNQTTLKQPQIQSSMGRILNADKNTTVYDAYNNPVEVPAGFLILPNGAYNTIEYNYYEHDEYGYQTHIPTVQDGIVIQDGEGNQFVWIPVGKIKNKSGDKNGLTTTITLGRYDFNYTDGAPIVRNNDTTKEETKNNHSRANAPAKDIETFISSVNKKGGYYLARYEASYGGPNKPLSKPSMGELQVSYYGKEYAPSTDDQIGMLWNNISQPDAAKAAQNMYNSPNFESDLTNSYAWDTTLAFLHYYSRDERYAWQTTTNRRLGNTGERTEPTNTTDKVCNIYDMGSNCDEWTTETAYRGGLGCALQ